MKKSNVFVTAVIISILCMPGLCVAGEPDSVVSIRLVDVDPVSFSTIGPNTVLRFEVDVEFLLTEQSPQHPVLVSVQFESKEDGKSVSKYLEKEFNDLPRISESESGLVLTYPVELVRQQRNLRIPVVARVVATVPPDYSAKSVRVGASDPVTFYVSEDW